MRSAVLPSGLEDRCSIQLSYGRLMFCSCRAMCNDTFFVTTPATNTEGVGCSKAPMPRAGLCQSLPGTAIGSRISREKTSSCMLIASASGRRGPRAKPGSSAYGRIRKRLCLRLSTRKDEILAERDPAPTSRNCVRSSSYSFLLPLSSRRSTSPASPCSRYRFAIASTVERPTWSTDTA